MVKNPTALCFVHIIVKMLEGCLVGAHLCIISCVFFSQLVNDITVRLATGKTRFTRGHVFCKDMKSMSAQFCVILAPSLCLARLAHVTRREETSFAFTSV